MLPHAYQPNKRVLTVAYCNRCGSTDHFGGQCPNISAPKVEPKTNVYTKPEGVRPETQYMREWRNRNRERYNAYQREYMRKYRARKDEETATVHGSLRHEKGQEEDAGEMPTR